jgi:hypothetical protein
MNGHSQQDKKCPTSSAKSGVRIFSTLSIRSQPPSKGERGIRYEVDASKLVVLNEVKHLICERDAAPHADGASKLRPRSFAAAQDDERPTPAASSSVPASKR